MKRWASQGTKYNDAQGTYSWEHNEQKASLQIQWEQTKKAWAKTRKWNKESQANQKEEQKQGKKQVQEKQWETTEAEKKERKGIGTGKKSQDNVSLKQPTPQT